jgi:hypothetical protein
MEAGLRIIFSGEVLDGFDRDAVKRSAAARLGVGPAMIEQIFSGRPVVLKKGLTLEAGRRYVILLERLGMRARLAPMRGSAPVEAAPPPAKPAEEEFDPERTHIASADAMRAFAAALGTSGATEPRSAEPQLNFVPPPARPAAKPAPAPLAPKPETSRPAPAEATIVIPKPTAPAPEIRSSFAATGPATEIPPETIAPALHRPHAPIPKTHHVPAPETVLVTEDGEDIESEPVRSPLGRYAFWTGVLCVLAAAAWFYLRSR